jgi:hypothetical protein
LLPAMIFYPPDLPVELALSSALGGHPQRTRFCKRVSAFLLILGPSTRLAAF